jgi:hypothetical protein
VPYTNEAPVTPGIHFALFADDTCIYSTKKIERRVLCKLQCGLTALKSWYEVWNTKINEEELKISISPEHVRVPENIPFANSAKCLGVIFDRKKTWRLNIGRIAAKALVTYIRTYSLIKSKCLSINNKRILYKVLIMSIIVYG